MIEADGLERRPRRATPSPLDGEEVHLTPTEFDLLRALARNRGRLMTHRELLIGSGGRATPSDTQVLRAHIANLRRKIEAGAERPALHPHRPRGRLPLRRLAPARRVAGRYAAVPRAPAIAAAARTSSYSTLTSRTSACSDIDSSASS